MNNIKENIPEDQRSLLLMHELEAGTPISQREIAGRLGIALGLVNAYLKTLAHKGFIQIKAYPRNRYAYLLTPEGFAEKSRLAYQHVTQFHRLFRTARQDSFRIFSHLRDQGVSELAFCGIDEFTEIAYLSLCDAGLTLTAVYDNSQAGMNFFGRTIQSLHDEMPPSTTPIIITSLRHADLYRQELLDRGIPSASIHGPIFGATQQ
jgi:DNA-binding MarR family transcriptional regulator